MDKGHPPYTGESEPLIPKIHTPNFVGFVNDLEINYFFKRSVLTFGTLEPKAEPRNLSGECPLDHFRGSERPRVGWEKVEVKTPFAQMATINIIDTSIHV